MKKLIFALCMGAVGCNLPEQPQDNRKTTQAFQPVKATGIDSYNEVKVIWVEGCEYVIVRNTYSGAATSTICHKGNCSNPIHTLKQTER